jgi:hypothetical protein
MLEIAKQFTAQFYFYFLYNNTVRTFLFSLLERIKIAFLSCQISFLRKCIRFKITFISKIHLNLAI